MTDSSTKILVLTPIYPWPGNPAEGIFVHRQVQNLRKRGHPIRVLNYHPAVPGLPRHLVKASWIRYHPRWIGWGASQDEVPVEHVFYHRPGRNSGDAVPRITDAVSRHLKRSGDGFTPDVVYAHWLWTGGAVALSLRDQHGWPVAAIARGSEMHRWQSIHPHCRAHVERVVAGADLLLANCDFLRARAASISGAGVSRARVAYNGCDTELFRPATDRVRVRREIGFDDHTNYFLCCAAVTEHKGLGDLAVAWQHLAPRHPDWRLVVLGSVEQREIARAFRRSSAGSVELRGQIPPDRIPRYLQAADAYVQPSRLEGMSNATMEAMSTALPVVTTDAGSQGELIDGISNGWLVASGEAGELALAMQEVIEDPWQAQKRAVAARRTIVNRFDARNEARRLSEFLTALHAESRGAAPSLSSRHVTFAPRLEVPRLRPG